MADDHPCRPPSGRPCTGSGRYVVSSRRGGDNPEARSILVCDDHLEAARRWCDKIGPSVSKEVAGYAPREQQLALWDVLDTTG